MSSAPTPGSFDETLAPATADGHRSRDAAASTDALERGATIGRYVVLRWLGAGGMGVVYAAYDPELDRKVALKLLRQGKAVGDPTEGRTRLVREAQALAKLTHPNVVAVHDVGTFEGQVFVAMEFVEGSTLGNWLSLHARPWRERLEIMLRAGEGLAAAHAKGLVHRDFKPENVMVGTDGRVRVMDFGLARAIAPETRRDDDADGQPQIAALAMELTRGGATAGTPVYMAAEQWKGGTIDARTDQFAYCVSLWEVLYGQRPFRGASVPEIAKAILAGRITEPDSQGDVPSSIRAVILRGLSSVPSDRFASMDELLVELGRDPEKARRRRIAIAAIASIGIGVFGWNIVDRRAKKAACVAVGAEIATAWSPEIRDEVRTAVASTVYGTDTLARVEPILDRHAAAWRELREQVCIAETIEREGSPELHARAVECLDAGRDQLAAYASLLAQGGAAAVERAVAGASSLPPVERCADEAWLLAQVRPPTDEARRAKVVALRRRITEAIALDEAGRSDEALVSARAVVGEAEALGWPPLHAEALVAAGTLATWNGELEPAERDLFAALAIATESRHDYAVLDALSGLVWNVGYQQARIDEGLVLGRVAEMSLARLGATGELLGVTLFNNLGALQHRAGREDDALASFERALELREKRFGADSLAVAKSLINVANIHRAEGRLNLAAPLFERAVATFEAQLGAEHPQLAAALNDLGGVREAEGDLEGARALYHRSLAIRRAAYGDEHPSLAAVLNNLGNLERATGDLEGAALDHGKALAIRERVLGKDHPDVAMSLLNLANVETSRRRYDEALALHRRALAIREAAFGPDHRDVGDSLVALADVHLRRGEWAEAESSAQRGMTIWETTRSPEDPTIAIALETLAQAEAELGKTDESIAHAERVYGMKQNDGTPAAERAWSRFVLAKALWTDPARRAEARRHAEAAKTDLVGGPDADRDRELVDAWLRTHAVATGP